MIVRTWDGRQIDKVGQYPHEIIIQCVDHPDDVKLYGLFTEGLNGLTMVPPFMRLHRSLEYSVNPLHIPNWPRDNNYTEAKFCSSPPARKPAANRCGYLHEGDTLGFVFQGEPLSFFDGHKLAILFREELERLRDSIFNFEHKQKICWLSAAQGSGVSTGLACCVATVNRRKIGIICLNFLDNEAIVTFDDGKMKSIYRVDANQLPLFRRLECDHTVVILDGKVPLDVINRAACLFRDADRIIFATGRNSGRADSPKDLTMTAWLESELVILIASDGMKQWRMDHHIGRRGNAKPNKRMVERFVKLRFLKTGGNINSFLNDFKFREVDAVRYSPQLMSEVASKKDDTDINIPQIVFVREPISQLTSDSPPRISNTRARIASPATAREVLRRADLLEVTYQIGELHASVAGLYYEDQLKDCVSRAPNGTIFETKDTSRVELPAVVDVGTFEKDDALNINQEVTFFDPKDDKNPGFDAALYVPQQSTLVYFQVTRCRTHSFDLENYQKFLTKFEEDNLGNHIVEGVFIFFVCDKDNFDAFKHAMPKGTLNKPNEVYITRFPDAI